MEPATFRFVAQHLLLVRLNISDISVQKRFKISQTGV